MVKEILLLFQPEYDLYLGLDMTKPVFEGLRTTQGVDQPAHSHSRRLISAFVIRLLERNICKLATCDISIF